MGKFKQLKYQKNVYKGPTNLKRGEQVFHVRGEKTSKVTFVSVLDKGLCKIINEEGKIDVVPEFEIQRGNDEQPGNEHRKDSECLTNNCAKFSNKTRRNKDHRNAS